jgi:hypothetical protein
MKQNTNSNERIIPQIFDTIINGVKVSKKINRIAGYRLKNNLAGENPISGTKAEINEERIGGLKPAIEFISKSILTPRPRIRIDRSHIPNIQLLSEVPTVCKFPDSPIPKKPPVYKGFTTPEIEINLVPKSPSLKLKEIATGKPKQIKPIECKLKDKGFKEEYSGLRVEEKEYLPEFIKDCVVKPDKVFNVEKLRLEPGAIVDRIVNWDPENLTDEQIKVAQQQRKLTKTNPELLYTKLNEDVAYCLEIVNQSANVIGKDIKRIINFKEVGDITYKKLLQATYIIYSLLSKNGDVKIDSAIVAKFVENTLTKIIIDNQIAELAAKEIRNATYPFQELGHCETKFAERQQEFDIGEILNPTHSIPESIQGINATKEHPLVNAIKSEVSKFVNKNYYAIIENVEFWQVRNGWEEQKSKSKISKMIPSTAKLRIRTQSELFPNNYNSPIVNSSSKSIDHVKKIVQGLEEFGLICGSKESI